MNTANSIDLFFAASLSSLVLFGLVTLGMTSALVAGGVAAAGYLAFNK